MPPNAASENLEKKNYGCVKIPGWSIQQKFSRSSHQLEKWGFKTNVFKVFFLYEG